MPKYRQIVVPLDGSSKAEEILPDVLLFANSLKSPVTVVQITQPPAQPGYLEDWQVTDESFRIVDEQAKRYLDSVADRLRQQGLESVEVVIAHGDPAAQILKMVEKEPDSLIAMATHGRSGFARWTLGSVTDKVVRHSSSPTLVIRSVGAAGEKVAA